jgi:hypothetical protein
MTGGTWSADFPVTAGAIASEPYGLRDAFLARLDANGSLAYATFFGGSGQEQGEAITVGEDQTIITGWTNSIDLQVTADALSGQNGGSFDAFVMVLNSNQQLDYATYLGGGDEDRGAAVATGPGGLLYVGGSTRSAEFWPNGFKNRIGMNAGKQELGLNGFVASLAPGENVLRYATFLTGMGDDRVTGLAVDPSGNAFVTGDTRSADFPDRAGAELNGEQDSFVTVISAAGNLRYSKLFGGSDWERGETVALDNEGNVYLGGATRSADFPITPGAYDTTLNDDYDAYLMKLILVEPISNPRLFLPVILQQQYHPATMTYSLTE